MPHNAGVENVTLRRAPKVIASRCRTKSRFLRKVARSGESGDGSGKFRIVCASVQGIPDATTKGSWIVLGL
jgi:hypothetical protein